jgi:hypothetical protein
LAPLKANKFFIGAEARLLKPCCCIAWEGARLYVIVLEGCWCVGREKTELPVCPNESFDQSELELKFPAANIPANKNKSEAEYIMSARAIMEQGPNDN